MSLKTWLLGTNTATAKRTVLHFYDDESFEFKKLPIKDTFFIVKQGEKIIMSWCHFFKLQFQFNGYKNSPGDQVSIVFDRDVLYDPHNILNKNEKPDNTGKFDQAFIKRIATGKIYEAQKQKVGSLMMDKITWALIGILGVEGLVFLVNKIW